MGEELFKYLKKEKKNEWVSGVIPGLLFHMCLSIVYCWSLVKINIDSHIYGDTSWAFSFMVCILALTAIFAGKYVKKHTKDAARYGAVLFSIGMIGSGLSCQLDSLWGLYFFFGGCLGIGAGLIYEVPLKILSKWFRGSHKSFVGKLFMILSTLSSFIMIPAVKSMVESKGIVPTFTIFGIIVLLILMIAAWFLEDPEDFEKQEYKKKDIIRELKLTLKNFHSLPAFICLWIILFINLSCGLAVISCEKDLMLVSGYSVVLGMGLARMFMPIGKGIAAGLLSKFKEGNIYRLWWIIYGLNIIAVIISLCGGESMWIAVLLVSAGYGASFVIQPRLLADLYGKRKVSRTHSMLLTAWAAAGLFGNQVGNLVYETGGGPKALMFTLGLLYVIGLVLSLGFKWIYNLEKK